MFLLFFNVSVITVKFLLQILILSATPDNNFSMNLMLNLNMEYEIASLPHKQLFDDMRMVVDTNEEDWCRMNDIVISNGQV